MRFLITLLLIFLNIVAMAQVGGERTFDFLNVATNAKTSALGGRNISVKADELGIAAANPSLLDSAYVNKISFTRASHFESATDISHCNLVYANQWSDFYYLASFNLMNYGHFTQYDEFGEWQGTFSGKDVLLTMALARPLTNRITAAFSFKPIYSQMESYKSFAIATDYSITYSDTARFFNLAAVVRNVGFQLKPYTSGNREQVPWAIDLGYTQKFRYAPLRISLTYHDLQSFDTRYREPETTNLLNETTSSDNKLERYGKNFMSHIIIGGELLLFKNMYVAAAYNFKRFREMDFETRSGINGLSFGLGLKVYKFYISYGHEKYYSSGGTNVFTFRADINEFRRN